MNIQRGEFVSFTKSALIQLKDHGANAQSEDEDPRPRATPIRPTHKKQDWAGQRQNPP